MQKKQGIKRFPHFHGFALTFRLGFQPLPWSSMWFFYRFMYISSKYRCLRYPKRFPERTRQFARVIINKARIFICQPSPYNFQLVKISLKVWHLQEWLPFNILLPWSYSKPPSTSFFSPIRFLGACHKKRQVSGAEITKIECWNVAKWFIHGYKIATRSEFKQKRSFYDGRNLNAW